MKKATLFFVLAGLVVLEYYLRLILSGFPVILVPELIIFFAVYNAKNRNNFLVAIVAMLFYDFWGSGLPGVSVMALAVVLVLAYLLSILIDLEDRAIVSGLTVLAGLLIYVLLSTVGEGFFWQRMLPELTMIAWPTIRELALVLMEAIVLLGLIFRFKFLHWRQVRFKISKTKRRSKLKLL